VVQTSPEYTALHGRFASPTPVDAWYEDELQFFVFDLCGEDIGTHREPPVAVFTIDRQSDHVLSAVIATPGRDGADPEIRHVGDADSTAAVVD
jgi:hypothetical protein